MITYLSFDSVPSFFSARRRAFDLSPAGLAARCGMTCDMIERLEQGRFLPSPSQAYRLGQVLNLDPVDMGSWALRELLLHPEYLVEHVGEAGRLNSGKPS